MEWETYTFGLMVTAACMLSLFSNDKNFNAAVAATWFLSLFWAGNTFLWMLDSVKYFVLTDSLFAGLTFAMFYVMRLRWLLILAIMYTGNFALDVLHLRGDLVYYDFACYSNWLFVAELVIACHQGIIEIVISICKLIKFLALWAYRSVMGK
jgi:hypothetical protein